jgi:hypothetical protein
MNGQPKHKDNENRPFPVRRTAQKEKGKLKDKSMTKEVTNTPETTQVTLLHSKKMWQT